MKTQITKIVYSTAFELFIIIALVTSVTLFFLDSVYTITPPYKLYVDFAEITLNILFCIEYFLRIMIANRKWRFVSYNIIDLLALIPFFRFFRLFRVFRVLRLIKLINRGTLKRWFAILSKKSSLFASGFQDRFVEGFLVFFILVSLLLVGTVGILALEKNINNHFSSFIDGLWWAVVTLTTVGYGDKFPITVGGKLLAIFLMLMGLSFFALLTSFISSFILERYRKGEEKAMDLAGLSKHIIICGWNTNGPTILHELATLYKDEVKFIVVIAEEKPDYPFLQNISFIQGDFTKNETLSKAHVETADSVIILSDHSFSRSVQDIDARTILATLSIKKNNPQQYVCAQVLTEENVEHLQNAGVNEYISSFNYTGNLLAHSVKNRGITRVYSEILCSREGNQLMKIKCPETYLAKTFEECSMEFTANDYGILIGLERESNYFINPENSITLRHADYLLFIGKEAPVL